MSSLSRICGSLDVSQPYEPLRPVTGSFFFHAMKTYWGWRHCSTITDLGTRLRWVVSFKPRPLCLQERAPGTHWSRSGRCGEQTNPCLCRESNPSRPDRSASLYRLSYPSSQLQDYTMLQPRRSHLNISLTHNSFHFYVNSISISYRSNTHTHTHIYTCIYIHL
jgi:hypothetical protein